MEIKQVLVPIDFSPPSTIALNYGIALARRFRSRLTLLHVIEPVPLSYLLPAEAAKLEQRRLEQAQRMLAGLVGPEDEDDLDLQVLVKAGDINREILSTVHAGKADVVVMGTHGRRLLGRWFIGSVTEHIVRKLTVPVLTVCRVSRPIQFNRILFAIDLSESSRDDLACVLDLASILRSRVVAVHVTEERIPLSLETPALVESIEAARQHSRDDARAELAEFKEMGAGRNVDVEPLLLEGPAGHAILKAAADLSIDLIVIAVRDKGFIERALGTTAEFLIREADIPVLSIPVGMTESPT